MVVFIFDVDDTLILHNNENNNYYETLNNGELKKLIENIKYEKLYIYTNGTYFHGENIVRNLLLSEYIPKDNIFGRDTIPYMKPEKKSFIYVDRYIKNNIEDKNSKIYFFDDLINNLVTAKSIGWSVVWISPNFIDKPDFIDYSFPNIFQALLFFKEV